MPLRVTISLNAAKGLLNNNTFKTTPSVLTVLCTTYPGSRHLCTTPLDLKIVKPSKRLNLIRNVENGPEADKERPLALLLAWYNSRQAHVMKFADLYLNLGFDVLFTSFRGLEFLRPRTGSQTLASEILTFLGDNLNRYDSMLVHGFSSGHILWGETMVKMAREPDVYPDLCGIVKGRIWDSFVNWDSVPRGAAWGLFPKSPLLRKAVEFTLKPHGKIFYNHTTKYYEDCFNHFHYTALKSPVLYFASQDDPIAIFDDVRASAKRSLENGNEVFLKSWPSSPHVGHYVHHKDEYVEEVLKFLQVVRLIEDAHKAAHILLVDPKACEPQHPAGALNLGRATA